MQTPKLLLFLGIWTMVLPHLGFPSFIKNILFFVTGILLVYLSILLRNLKKENHIKKIFENFSENLHLNSK